ncbi:DUF488 family protein [Streptomyces sp. RS10V-4]|uniref:DUF488 domain-containing protein n=1 Tax=Streptomyces rhizoryzae TaxID=2932493 RepID=UPI002005CB7F|nr:DUF488 family protein [Streptomyces rhizoryzae]MCK7622280.1 DUF488 family protein [Streptomyces rhizoryzae]
MMSGEELSEGGARAAGETALRVWTESVYAVARPWPGTRVLVDRRLPLGRLPKSAAPDVWLAAVAPSAALWRWYGTREDRYEAFARRYEQELRDAVRAAGLSRLRALAGQGPVVLRTAVAPLHLSHARVLTRCLLTGRAAGRPAEGGDAACWLGAVCSACGRPVTPEGAARCPSCHASTAR